MELILAVVVVAAVILFGALISFGNERQRHAIDSLHQAYKQWAVQDLRLKRGTVSAQTDLGKLTDWLTKVTSLALSRNIVITDYQLHNSPVTSVEFHDVELGATIVVALEAPEVLIPILRRKYSIVRGELRSNPLFHVGKQTSAIELSILNAGTMFDVELPVAWNRLTGHVTESATLWAYIVN